MAGETTQTPVAAPAPPPVAPDINTPAPAAIPNTGSAQDATMAQLAGPAAAANAAAKQATADAAPTPQAPPGPHDRLKAMVQGLANGLATGLTAAGTSLATHGAEGGAKEVQQIQAAQQEQKIQAQQAAIAAKNAKVQQDLTVFDTNQKLMQNILLMATAPDELTAKHMQAVESTQAVQKGGIDIQNARHESMAQWGIDPLVPPNASQTSNVEGATKVANGLIKFASDPRVLGPDDPAVKSAQDALTKAQQSNDPNEVAMAIGGLRRAIDYHSQAVDMGIKQQTQADAAPLGGEKVDSLNAGLLQRYQIVNPGAKALPKGLSLSADATPKDFDRVDKIMQQTENAKGTQASRDLADQIRQQNLLLLKGPQGIDPTVTGKAYLDQLQTVDPTQAAEIKGYAEGRLELTPQAARTAQGQGLLKQILRGYPDYDQTNAPAYTALRKNFEAGQIGTGINSYNTAINHLGQMFDHVSNASNIDLNNPLSTVHRQLATDQAFVSGELAKAVSNGQMTEGEKDQMEAAISGKTFGVATSDKYKTQIKEAVGLLNGKLDAYGHQWETGMAKGVDPFPVLTPQAQSTIAHISGTGGAAPSGKAVSLKAAMALPVNAGKTEDQVRADIVAHGHQVGQ